MEKVVKERNGVGGKVKCRMGVVNYYEVVLYVEERGKEWKGGSESGEKMVEVGGMENYGLVEYEVYKKVDVV